MQRILALATAAAPVASQPLLAAVQKKLGMVPNLFKTLTHSAGTRLEVVVTFLALLELVKRYRVSARQDVLFGDIQIERSDDWNTEEEFELEFE